MARSVRILHLALLGGMALGGAVAFGLALIALVLFRPGRLEGETS